MYRDTRKLELKMLEHRIWNTNEVACESAGLQLGQAFMAAIEIMDGNFDWALLSQKILQAATSNNTNALDGFIRIGIFACNETPNRFKAIYPAYLLQEETELIEPQIPSAIDIKKLINTMVSFAKGKSPENTIDNFIGWLQSKNSEDVLKEIFISGKKFPNTIFNLCTRLAQGADTNKRGHGATDILKERMGEWGLLPHLGNINTTDVPVSSLVDNYSGPRKYDIVVWNPFNEICLVSQSQMYTSDVGSIQGKTVEEDATANRALLAKYPNCAVLTHTEGFGCHTTMSSRLKHVLTSDISGFIQIRTLDIKLRRILHAVGGLSPLDIEIALVSASNDLMAAQNIIDSSFPKGSFDVLLKKMLSAGLLAPPHNIFRNRLAIISYYIFLDYLVTKAVQIPFLQPSPMPPIGTPLSQNYVRIGGLPYESGVTVSSINEAQGYIVSLTGVNYPCDYFMDIGIQRGVLIKCQA